MNLNIDLEKIANSVRVEMEKEAQDLMRRRIRHQFSTLFNNGQHWGATKGIGFMMIEQCLDELITADTFTLMVEDQARAYFQSMLDEQIKYQMARKAKKVAAEIVKNTLTTVAN